MSHIEKNQCPGIRKEDFEAQRALVAIGLHKACQNDPDSIGIMSLGPSTTEESSVGGVPVTDSILDENEPPSELNKNMPSLGRIDSNDSSDMSTASANRIRGYENSYPALNSVQDKGKGKQHRTSGSVTGNDERPDPIGLTWSQHNFPDAPRTPAIANWNQVPASDTSYVNTIDALSGQLGHFRIIDMKPDHTDGLYHCPFDKCR